MIAAEMAWQIDRGPVAAELRVLGPFEVTAPDGRRVRLGGPKQRAVLAVLALRANDVVPATTIVRVLWGESAPPSAVALVRTYVSRLRKILAVIGGVRLVNRSPGYVLEVDPDRVDAHRFVRLVRQGREAIGVGRLDVASAAFDEALGLWRGDMLADLSRMEALRPEITRMEEIRLFAVEDRIDVELTAGHHVEVIGELESLTSAHPFRERLWSQLIVALYRCGRQAEALTAYRSVRSILVDQFGVEPGPDLQALEHDVLKQAPELRWRAPAGRLDPSDEPAIDTPGGGLDRPADAPDALQVPLPPGMTNTAHRRPFVGRQRERARLAECLEDASAGRFTAAFVAGPPGIGKTALAGWFSRKAHAEGATVVLGRADEGADVPFLPLGEAIRHWATHVPVAQLALLGEVDAVQLARLVPDVAERRGDPPPPSAAEPASPADRQPLFRAIGRWVEALSAGASVVLVVLEDLHWADPATLLAIRHLLRHPPEAGALLLATYRDTEKGGLRELTELLANVHGDRQGHRVNLAGLLDADVIDLLSTEAGGQLDPDGRAFAARLNHAAGGNPLFIHETIQHLTEQGAIRPAAQHWADQRSSTSFGVPSAVVDVIEQRLERLPAPTTTLLRQAAVVGEHFDPPILSRIVDMAEISVIETLDPAVSAGLVTYEGPRADRFAFSHSLVREAILASLPLGQRARTHWKAGLAIELVSSSHPERPLGEIARHLAAGVHAGDPRTAVAANVHAGQQAMASLAFEDARTRFATATELALTSDVSDPELSYEAWSGLGWASCVLADLDGLRNGLLQAAVIAREQRWPQRLVSAAIGLAAAVGGRHDSDDQSMLTALVDEALASLGSAPSADHCLLIGLVAVRVAALEGGDARPLAKLATELTQSIDDPTARAGALMAQAWTLAGTPYAHDLTEVTEHALSLEVPNGSGLMLSLVGPLLPTAALQLGDRERFEAVRSRLAADPRVEDTTPHVAAYVRMWDAAVALSQGRFTEVERLGATIPRVSDWWFWQVMSEAQSNLAARERGYPTPRRKALIDFLTSKPPEPIAAATRALLSALHAEAGDHAAAAHEADLLRRRLTLRQLGWSTPFVLRHLAEVAALGDNADLAADLLPVLTDYRGQILVSFAGMTIEAAADRSIGQVLVPLGRLDEAIEAFGAAHTLERSLDAHALTSRTVYWHARSRLQRNAPGDYETARHLLDQASSQARKLGMSQLERDMETLTQHTDVSERLTG